ncbi:cytochrome P450 704C1-like [Phalaenopsis equestris]|uniref:cytochrome P450 704C1-like n=1 Tax=Phalaenopsis equestris TaxID=78828 RepID=UPI0009E202CF|nr:cytochrome P450 704C1-like [Phalaenopsis equestris]
MELSLAFLAACLPTISILVLVSVAIKSFGCHRILSRKAKKRYHPIAGTIFQKFLNFKRLHDYLTDVSRKYKTFRLYAPFHNLIYTTDPAIVEHILKTNFKNYGKGQINYENLKELFGDGIFRVDGEKWHHQRKLATSEFSTRALRNYNSSVFKTNAAKLAHMISEKARSNVAMDIQELFMSSTMDSIFKVGFGFDLKNLDGSVDGVKFTKAFDNLSVYTIRRYVDPFWKIKRLFNIGCEAKFKEDIKVLNDFIYNLIRAKNEQINSGKNNLEKKEDILSRLMTEMEKDPENITFEYLRDITLNFVIAGKDTTAGTLSWFLYLLCKHSAVQEKIFQEVKQATQAKKDISINEFMEKITEEALDKMKYLHAALSETLRLFPAVPLEVKSCFSDDTLPDGFNVNKGDVVFYMPYAMGRMEELWGNDAENFQPERWIDDDGSIRNESPFKFTAFQAGPRICLGKDFAYVQMKIFAAVLLHFFKFRLSCQRDDVRYKTMITLHIDQGLHVHTDLR